MPGERRRRMHNQAGDHVRCRFARKACHLDIAETMECKVGFVDFHAFALQRVRIGRCRRAQIGGVDGAIRVQHFSMTQGDRLTGFPAHFQPHGSDHVLPEVEHVSARLRLGDRHGVNFLRDLYGRIRLGNELRVDALI